MFTKWTTILKHGGNEPSVFLTSFKKVNLLKMMEEEMGAEKSLRAAWRLLKKKFITRNALYFVRYL